MAAEIGKKAGIDVVLDRKALDDVGIGVDTPDHVSRLGHHAPLGAAPDAPRAGPDVRDPGRGPADHHAGAGRNAAGHGDSSRFPTWSRVPDASGKTACDFEPLVDLVTSTVRPTAWDEVGGPGAVTGCTLGKARFLVVSQTPDVLDEVFDLVGAIRDVARERAAGKLPEAAIVGDRQERTPAVEAIRKALDARFSFEFTGSAAGEGGRRDRQEGRDQRPAGPQGPGRRGHRRRHAHHEQVVGHDAAGVPSPAAPRLRPDLHHPGRGAADHHAGRGRNADAGPALPGARPGRRARRGGQGPLRLRRPGAHRSRR